ncbi:MAG: MerC domain-containing protein [Crocinitomicaceae bacterium]
MNSTLYKPDSIGALASSLCLIHCAATPFLFIAQSCSATCCESAPSWWVSLDYLFLALSFWAIYQSTQNTSKKIMKPLLWTCWSALFLAIINEKLEWISLSQNITNIIALSIAVIHIYNLKYCQCQTENCCPRSK